MIAYSFVHPSIARRLSLFLCVLCALCGGLRGQEFRTVADGVEYAEAARHLSDKEPARINLLRLDLTKVRIDARRAMDAAIGTERTSSIAARHGAIAAVNAGFFRLDTSIFAGDSAGVFVADNAFLSESVNGRVALMISNGPSGTDVYIDRADLGHQLNIGGRSIIVGTNRQRGENDVVVYTSHFHRTTLTDPNGVEFVVQKNRVRSIADRSGSSEIPADGFIISASGTKRGELLSILKQNSKVTLTIVHSSPVDTVPAAGFGRSEDIVGGVPRLIKNGKIDITWQEEKAAKAFAENRHPRTAVAKLRDGKFLMVTVDGRQPNVSVGMTLRELAEFLLELGAVDAMNLDGGGSTTMVVQGKIVNRPSDKEGERKVSDALLVTLRPRIVRR